jgi:hypothetical protein
MPDFENESELKALLRRVCKPVRASPKFKDDVYGQIVQEAAAIQQDLMRILGLRPSTWIALVAGLAICLIIYGVVAVPDPSSSVIIDSVPSVPHSFLSTPTL